jgi:hypothetical protein
MWKYTLGCILWWIVKNRANIVKKSSLYNRKTKPLIFRLELHVHDTFSRLAYGDGYCDLEIQVLISKMKFNWKSTYIYIYFTKLHSSATVTKIEVE